MSLFALDPLPRSLAAALSDSKDKKAGVRASAVKDLGRHAQEGDSRAAEALVEALGRDASAEVRSAAALALADAREKSGLGALMNAARDSDVRVQEMALLALGEIGDGADAALLAAVELALKDDRAELRFQAVIAAHRLRAPGAREVLLEATEDSDAKVRHVVFRLLEERAQESESEARLDPETRRAALSGLDDGALSVRVVAAILLARSGDLSGRHVLVEAVNRRSGDVELDDEQAAIELVGELGITEAAPALLRRSRGGVVGRDPLAFEARIALARLGDARAKEKILAGLRAWTKDTRTLAVVAAGRARLREARDAILAMRDDPGRAEPEAVTEALSLLDGG